MRDRKTTKGRWKKIPASVAIARGYAKPQIKIPEELRRPGSKLTFPTAHSRSSLSKLVKKGCHEQKILRLVSLYAIAAKHRMEDRKIQRAAYWHKKKLTQRQVEAYLRAVRRLAERIETFQNDGPLFCLWMGEVAPDERDSLLASPPNRLAALGTD